MKVLYRLFRIKQWVKNSFIFLPLIFSGNLFNTSYWLPTLIAFFSFSFTASAVYCLNDIRDVDADRRHPQKRTRPIASGRISVSAALCITFLLLFASAGLLFLLSPEAAVKVAIVQAVYLLLNIAYCFWLKRFPIIDVCIIAFGFVLRLADGAVATDIWLSPWIVCMTFLLTLFMAFAKRRDDVLLNLARKEEAPIREGTQYYTTEYLNLVLGILAAVTLVCYLMYCISPDTMQRFHCDYIYVTFIFVLAAILRYLMLAVVKGESGSPTDIALHDRFIQLCVTAWIATFALIIYAL